MDQLFHRSKYYYAVISGICAAWGSLCGKLSGNFSGELSIDNTPQLILKAVFICMMLMSNAAVWTYYVRALQAASTTILPTVVSTASNYLVSAVAGFIIFKEQINFFWSCGMFLVIAGLALVVQSDTSLEDRSIVDKKES